MNVNDALLRADVAHDTNTFGAVALTTLAAEVRRLNAQAQADADEIFRLQVSHSALYADVERLRAALNWYADEARACAKNSGSAKHGAPEALLASVTVLALDGGRRADAAMKDAP
jgi:hypothetical protein